jgi:hypothetical protein
MKKIIVVTIGVLVGLTFALAIIPTTRDEIHWQWACYNDVADSYEAYITTWPDGRHVADAKDRIESLRWQEATAANTISGFDQYLQLHSEGKHVADAKDRIESLRWQEATATNTVQGFEQYLQLYSQGKHVADAKDRIESLHWQAAISTNKIRGFEQYMQRYSEGKYVGEAKDKIQSLYRQGLDAPEGVFLLTGRLVRPDGSPVDKADVMVKGMLKTFEDGGIGFFIAKTDSDGYFRIAVDTAKMEIGKNREITLQTSAPNLKRKGIPTMNFSGSELHNKDGLPVVYKLAPDVTHGVIPFGEIETTYR